MANLLEALSISGGALAASQYGSRVAANNIANVSTPGYSRQTLLQTSAQSPLLGVKVDGVARHVDESLSSRLRNQSGTAAGSSTRSQYASRIETVLDPAGDGGIGAKLDAMFTAYRTLSSTPQNTTARSAALASVDALTSSVRTTATNLRALQTDADSEIAATVDEANALTTNIANLNRAIGAATDQRTQDVGTLRDQRDVALQRLSELVGATAVIDDRNIATVSVGGVGVVIGENSRPLELTNNTTTGFRDISVRAPTPVVINGKLGPSSATSLITARDVTIAGQINSLDTFARDLATALNGVQSAHVGLDGSTGLNLLSTGAQNGAATLTVDTAVAGNPARLATTTSSTSPGDNTGVLAMLTLQTSLSANGGTSTLQQAAQASITSAGAEAARALSDNSVEQVRLSQLTSAREDASGVSIEEEMLSVERYQRAYQAAAKVITTVNEMLDSLMRM